MIKMIRKGLVFILTDKVEDTYNYIISKIDINTIIQVLNKLGQKIILLNDYRIIITDNTTLIARGHKPELSYVIGDTKPPKFGDVDFLSYLSNMSTRKEPVRKIDSLEQIDIKEFLDDEYAEEKYCDKRKVERWDDIMNPKEVNIEKFKQEYECTWIGKE
jgi:hypothetical protein